jgi:hypothetical protein
MPMKSDPEGGSTNADGSKNLKYCSYCYKDGEFHYTGDSVKEFQEFCREKMVESGHSKFTSWLFTRGMSRLERWKN